MDVEICDKLYDIYARLVSNHFHIKCVKYTLYKINLQWQQNNHTLLKNSKKLRYFIATKLYVLCSGVLGQPGLPVISAVLSHKLAITAATEVTRLITHTNNPDKKHDSAYF